MKYVLGFLFEYKYYKNPANIKIFSNNQLIDEIDLTEDINMKNITPTLKEILTYKQMRKLAKLADPFLELEMSNIDPRSCKYPSSNIDPRDTTEPFIFSLRDNGILQIPKKVFVYTLDETILQNSIKIEITNNNTNYSNGFMTKCSSFIFHKIFLIPTYYLNIKNYNLFFKRQVQIITKNIPDYPLIRNVRNKNDHLVWDIMDYNLMWPAEDRTVKNGQFAKYDDEINWKGLIKGGSFSLELPIIEYIHEKGLKMLGPRNYEQLVEKEKRRLSIGTSSPLYFKYLNLINTQNETT